MSIILFVFVMTAVIVCHSDEITTKSIASISQSSIKPIARDGEDGAPPAEGGEGGAAEGDGGAAEGGDGGAAEGGEDAGQPKGGAGATVDIPDGLANGRVVELTIVPSGNFVIDLKGDDQNIALHFVGLKAEKLALCNEKKDGFWQTEYRASLKDSDWSKFSFQIIKDAGEFQILNNGTRLLICKHSKNLNGSTFTKAEVGPEGQVQIEASAVLGGPNVDGSPAGGEGGEGAENAGGEGGGNKNQNTPFKHEVNMSDTDKITIIGNAIGNFSIALQTTDSTEIVPDIGLILLFRLAETEGIMAGNSFIKYRWGDEHIVMLKKDKLLFSGFKIVIAFGYDAFQVTIPDEKPLIYKYKMPLAELGHVVVRGSAFIKEVAYKLRDAA